MPYTMTKAQATRRLVIRAFMDEHPRATYKEVQARFHAGPTVVRDASCKTAWQWASIVLAARDADVPRAPVPAAKVPVHRPATSASPGLIWHPGRKQDERFSRGQQALGDGDDGWLPEPVDFDQDAQAPPPGKRRTD